MKIALPSGKSLEDATKKLFEDAFIPLQYEARKCRGKVNHSAISNFAFYKPKQIPKLVEAGLYNTGICGRDTVCESGADVKEVCELSYSRATSGGTRCVLFADENDCINDAKDVPEGSAIISEYPKETEKFFAELGVKTKIAPCDGSVETYVVEGHYRFGVCLCETGETLRKNGLKVIGDIFQSSTVLIANREAFADEKKRDAIRELELLLTGALSARDAVLVSMNASASKADEIIRLLPSLKSPTISALADKEFISMSSVVPKSDIKELVPRLLRLGASGIIVTPLLLEIDSW